MKKTIVRILLLVCLVMALCLCMAACKEKEQPAADNGQQIELYWNVEAKEYNSGTYTRTANDDGHVMMLFSKDGEQVRLPVKDYFLACKLDVLGVAGLVFDENGVVVEALRIEDCTGGYIAKNCVVTSVEGTTVTCNTSGLLDGREIVFELPEGTPIWNVAGTGITVGIPWTVGVDDLVTVVKNEDGSVRCVYTEGYTEPMDIYWNVNRKWDSGAKVSTRMSDPTGGYTVTLACNGEVKDYRVKDSSIVHEIDAMAAKCMGLEFDEEGYIIRVIHGGSATGGGSAASWYDCIEMDEQRAEFKRILSGSNVGNTYSGMKSRNMKVFDVSGNGAYIGEPTELRVGDRVHCLLDSRYRLSVVFVVSRKASSPIYWNVDRMWDSKAGETTRKPNANGVYEILVAVNGEQKYVYTTDPAIVNKIDGRAAMCFGLRVDDNNNIEKFYTPDSVTSGTFASWYNITKLDGNNIELLKSNGDFKTGKIAADCEIYDCSPSAQYEGIKTTLQEGDLVHTLKNDKGEVSVAFVITRYVRWPVYYNLDRKWNDTTKTTTRTREADGYFHFRMAVDGQEVMLKTKSYDVANAIDKEIAMCVTLSVDENGIIYKAMHAKNSTLAAGAARSSYTKVTAVGKNSFTTYKSTNDKTTVEKMAWNCKVYNVSSNYISHQGEETTVQEGDSVHCLSNLRGEITFVYVYARPLSLPVYYNLDRMWDDTAKVSTRQPNGDGEYEFQLAYGGGEVTLYTTDPQVVHDIDKEVAMCVALRVDENGYITYATHAKNSTYCGGGIGMSYATVTEVSGNQVTVRKDGKLTTFTISDDCEMFVTKNIEGLSRGNYTTVRVGDFVHCLKNKNNETNYMAIMSRVKQLPTADHTCQHVTEAVTWYQWDGGAFPMEGHYVLTEDLTLDSRVTIDAGVEITLCLNGHTVTNSDRFFNLYGTLNICDHKDASGNYQGTLDSAYSGKVYGSLAYLYNNKSDATLNIYGGNFVHSGEAYNGGIVFIGQTSNRTYTATMNLYDGVLTGGVATGKGGAVAITNYCTFNMYGGEITGNKATSNGGAIYLAQGEFNMSGGVIRNNTATGNGGAVDNDGGVFNMTGGILENNKGAEGGNVRTGQNAETNVSGAAIVRGGNATGGAGGNFTTIGKLNVLDGATVSGGKAHTQGSAISAFANASAAHAIVTIKNVTIDGTVRTDTGSGPVELFITDSTVTGQVKVGVKDCSLTVEGKVDLPNVYLTDGKFITIGENGLDATSSIKVTVVNYDVPFVTVTDEAQKAVFKPYKTGEKIKEDGSDLYIEGTTVVINHKHCVCGDLGKVEDHKTCSTVSYSAWTETSSLPTSGTYVLMEDVTISGPITVSSTLNLCLNGHTITGSTRVFSINKGTLNLCDCADTQGKVIGNTTGTQANGGVFYVYNNSTFNLYGGTLTAAKKVTGEGGVGCVAGGTNGKMYMYGGVIENGQATKNGGNIVMWDGASMFVYGGVIQNGTSTGGGNIGVTKGNLTITGGKLIGGTSSGYGGNIRVGQDGMLTVTGGEVLGGTANSGGATIYGNQSGTNVPDIYLLGGKITAGTTNSSSVGYKGILAFGTAITVGGDVQIEDIYVNNGLINSTDKPLTSEASIGISGTTARVVIENISQAVALTFKNNSKTVTLYYDAASQTLELV